MNSLHKLRAEDQVLELRPVRCHVLVAKLPADENKDIAVLISPGGNHIDATGTELEDRQRRLEEILSRFASVVKFRDIW